MTHFIPTRRETIHDSLGFDEDALKKLYYSLNILLTCSIFSLKNILKLLKMYNKLHANGLATEASDKTLMIN